MKEKLKRGPRLKKPGTKAVGVQVSLSPAQAEWFRLHGASRWLQAAIEDAMDKDKEKRQ